MASIFKPTTPKRSGIVILSTTQLRAMEKYDQLKALVIGLQKGTTKFTWQNKLLGYDLIGHIDNLIATAKPEQFNPDFVKKYNDLKVMAQHVLTGKTVDCVREQRMEQKLKQQYNCLQSLLDQPSDQLNQWSRNELADQIQRELETLKLYDSQVQGMDDFSPEYFASDMFEQAVITANGKMLKLKGRCEQFKLPINIKNFDGGSQE